MRAFSVSAFFLFLSTNTEVSSSPFLFNQREKLKIQTTARSVNFPKCVIFTQVGPLASKPWLHLLELRHLRTWNPTSSPSLELLVKEIIVLCATEDGWPWWLRKGQRAIAFKEANYLPSTWRRRPPADYLLEAISRKETTADKVIMKTTR